MRAPSRYTRPDLGTKEGMLLGVSLLSVSLVDHLVCHIQHQLRRRGNWPQLKLTLVLCHVLLLMLADRPRGTPLATWRRAYQGEPPKLPEGVCGDAVAGALTRRGAQRKLQAARGMQKHMVVGWLVGWLVFFLFCFFFLFLKRMRLAVKPPQDEQC